MKRYILLLVFPLFFLSSCEEIAPVVIGSDGGGGGNTTVKDQKRQVLIEEFTGVRCVNCPAGSAFISDLLAINAPQLIAVSIHAGEFAPPYPQSLYDFRTPEGDQLLSYLGEPFGYPTAVVNRSKFDGQFDLQLGQGEWAGYIAEEKESAPKVRIDIKPEFNSSTRELKVKVALFVDETITDDDVTPQRNDYRKRHKRHAIDAGQFATQRRVHPQARAAGHDDQLRRSPPDRIPGTGCRDRKVFF